MTALARSFLALSAAGASAIMPAGAPGNAPTTGRSITTLAPVTLTSRAGADIVLGSRIIPGRPTLISIWASWCPPCVAEAPYLDKMRRDLGGKYNFVYINRRDRNPDPQQPPMAVAQFLARAGLSDIDYVVADVKAYRRIVGADINDIPVGAVGIPRVYLFDGSGRQIYTAYGFGAADGPGLEQRVRQAIGK